MANFKLRKILVEYIYIRLSSNGVLHFYSEWSVVEWGFCRKWDMYVSNQYCFIINRCVTFRSAIFNVYQRKITQLIIISISESLPMTYCLWRTYATALFQLHICNFLIPCRLYYMWHSGPLYPWAISVELLCPFMLFVVCICVPACIFSFCLSFTKSALPPACSHISAYFNLSLAGTTIFCHTGNQQVDYNK